MKILYISEYFPPYTLGGAEISTALLVGALPESIHPVVLTGAFASRPWSFARAQVYPLLARARLSGSSLSALARSAWSISLGPLENARRARRFINEQQPDLIHMVLTSYQALPTALAVLASGRPVVVDVRDYALLCPAQLNAQGCSLDLSGRHGAGCLAGYYHSPHPAIQAAAPLYAQAESLFFHLYTRRFRTAVRAASNSRLVAISQFIRGVLLNLGYPAERVGVIYNLLDESLALPKRDACKTILYAGRLERSKGIWDALEAFRRLDDPQAELLIAGAGSEEQPLRAELAARPSPRIRLLGKRPYNEMAELFAGARVLLAPSVWPEPFGRFILDSFATRTPLVATTVGAIPEVVRNRETGLLVPPGEPQRLAEALAELLGEGQLYQHIAGALPAEAERFRPAAIIPQRLDLYRALEG